MIIGSTYPLYAANHAWTGSDATSRGRVFPSDDAQGVYNAAVVQIARLTGPARARNESEEEKARRWEREGEYLIEYSTPAPLQTGMRVDAGVPPVWVSVVGERSIYPVDCRLFEPNESNSEGHYLYLMKMSLPSPERLVINRAVAWVVFLAAASLILLISYSRRLWHGLKAGPRPRFSVGAATSELALTVARLIVLAGYLYVACPAFTQLIPGTIELNLVKHFWLLHGFPWLLALLPTVVVLSAVLAALVEFRAGHSSWRALEAAGGVLIIVMVGFAQFKHAADPRWLLSLDRSAAITGGVSAYVPVAFMMAALGAWLYARRRIRSINETFAFKPAYDQRQEPARDANRAILEGINKHRARFDGWFVKPIDLFSRSWGEGNLWNDVGPTLIAAALLAGTFTDTLVFRPISWSDEGVIFDLFFRLAFGLVLTFLALNFARLYSAWGDFHAVLDGLGKTLGGAFERIPKNVSNWLIDTESCNAEYGNLIVRELCSARKLLTDWDKKAEPPKTSVAWDTEKTLSHLSILERHVRADRSNSLDDTGEEVESFRYLARALSPYWADAAILSDATAPGPEEEKGKRAPTREEKIIEELENLLALEAARWVGGAMVRVWISIGFLALSAVAMLFAITSYPFPEQSRVMTVIGFAIAALVVMILRVALGSSRNDVISKIEGTAPGRITWDSTLFSSMAAYVVPLLGLLTAISFDMLDLFRSVLGPILRIFP